MNIILSNKSKLPNCLSNEEIKELFTKMQEGDLNAREEIIKHNSRLVLIVIKKICRNKTDDKEDLFSIGMIGLIKAVDTFRLDMNIKFSSYASICIKNEILMYFRKSNRIIKNEVSTIYKNNETEEELSLLNINLDESVNIDLDYENKDTYRIINKLVNSLPEKERTIMEYYYGFNNQKVITQREISQKMGIGQTQVCRKIKRILKKLREELIKQNIIDSGDNGELLKTIKKDDDRSVTVKKKEKVIKLPSIEEYLEEYSKEDRKIMFLGLTEKEKYIINKYFFLEGNKPYLQEEIALQLGMTVDELNKEIREIINKMKRIYKEEKEKQKQTKEQSIENIMNIINEPKKKGRKVQSIYELFKDYSKEEINEMLSKLNDEDKELLIKRYGNDLENPMIKKDFTDDDRKCFYGKLLPKMRMLLKKTRPDTDITKEIKDNKLEKKDYLKVIELMRSYSFHEMLKLLTPKEAVIICLRLGYVDNKFYSTTAISNFLGLKEKEILEITKKILLLFKKNINSYIDETIEYAEKEEENVRGK